MTASDPYVEVWLGGGNDGNDPKKSKHRTYKTRVEKYNLNPVWDEEMVWELERSSIDMGEEVQLYKKLEKMLHIFFQTYHLELQVKLFMLIVDTILLE